MKVLTASFFLTVLGGCLDQKSKKNHRLTVNFCEYKPNTCTCNLYGELYTVYGMGALGSDVFSEYLTDSVNFRIYVGTYDEGNEMIKIKCAGDSIHVVKVVKENEGGKSRLVEHRAYSLKGLKQQHNFE